MTRTEAYNELERLRDKRLISNIGVSDPYHNHANWIRSMESSGGFDPHTLKLADEPAKELIEESKPVEVKEAKNPFAEIEASNPFAK